MCVQRFDDSQSSAIRITYRISLRSSSFQKPRYPSLIVVFLNLNKQLQLENSLYYNHTQQELNIPTLKKLTLK